MSVIIPTYNRARFVVQAIDSVLAQSLPAHEVIVVDDGSTDDTSAVLAGYGTCIRRVTQRNQGVAAARNNGACVASGEWLAFLDSDDIWMPCKLERQLERVVAEPSLGLVHCAYEQVDVAGRPLGQQLDGLEGWVASELLLFRRPVISALSTVMIPRRVFEDVGRFDPDRRLAPSEDFDLYYRIARRYKVGFVPEVLVKYRLHGGNAHLNVRRMAQAMLLIYRQIFDSAAPEVRGRRRKAYGNLHRMLAGSMFRAKRPDRFLRHAFLSLWLTPENMTWFIGRAVRWLWRLTRRERSGQPMAADGLCLSSTLPADQ